MKYVIRITTNRGAFYWTNYVHNMNAFGWAKDVTSSAQTYERLPATRTRARELLAAYREVFPIRYVEVVPIEVGKDDQGTRTVKILDDMAEVIDASLLHCNQCGREETFSAPTWTETWREAEAAYWYVGMYNAEILYFCPACASANREPPPGVRFKWEENAAERPDMPTGTRHDLEIILRALDLIPLPDTTDLVIIKNALSRAFAQIIWIHDLWDYERKHHPTPAPEEQAAASRRWANRILGKDETT